MHNIFAADLESYSSINYIYKYIYCF
jgi:hypothetical protein